jgi:hypothetical protein
MPSTRSVSMCLTGVVILLSLNSHAGAQRFDAENVRTILQACASFFHAADPLYLEATVTQKKAGTVYIETYQLHALTSSDRYRITLQTAVPGAGGHTTTRAFDGNVTYMLRDQQMLEISQGPFEPFSYGPGKLHPLTHLFLFAQLTPDDWSLVPLQRQQSWDALLPLVKDCTPVRRDGAEGFRLRIASPSLIGGAPNQFDVFFDRGRNYLPVEWTFLNEDTGAHAVCRVSATEAVKTEKGILHLPTQIEIDQTWPNGPENAETMRIDVASETFQVGHKVDSREFIVSRALADKCYDTRTGRVTESSGRTPLSRERYWKPCTLPPGRTFFASCRWLSWASLAMRIFPDYQRCFETSAGRWRRFS